jgi:hypothetical protein
MVEADDPCNLPPAVFVLPEMNEFSFADPLGVFMAGMMEAENPDLERAIAFLVVGVQISRNQFPRGFAANVFLTVSVRAALPSVTPP